MSLQHVSSEANGNPLMDQAARRRLHGGPLILARVLWLLLAVLTLGLFCAGIPIHLHVLLTLSLQAERALQYLPPGAGRSLLKFALSANVYPAFDLTLEIALVLLLSLISIVRFWHKSDDWVVILFSPGYMLFGTYITHPLNALLTVFPLWRLPINFVQACGAVFAVLIFYRFPDGRFVSAWTRSLALLCLVWNLAWVLFPGLPFNASNIYSLSLPALLVLLLWMVTGIVALLLRYPHLTSLHQRQQTRLFTISAMVGVATYAAYAVPQALFPALSQPGVTHVLYTMIGNPLYLVAAVLVPLFLFFSIQRYHLFDIEVLINRTLIYGTLTGTLALVYFGLVFVLQFLLRGFIGQTNNLTIVISTLAVAALFQPLRRRIQSAIDRRFYRRKYDAAKTLAAFSATLRSEVDLDQLRERLVAVVQETMQPRHVSLWLRKTEQAVKPRGIWR
jgi:hypothetical protein